MSEWIEHKLGNVVTFQRGFDITKKEQVEGEYPVISSSGANSTHNEYKVEGPGVIIGRKGTLGTVHYWSGRYWPHDTTLWIKDFQGNDPQFIYYFLQGLGLEQYDVGASNPTLNRNHIHLLEVVVPDVETQRRIAAMLSAYDDLIENNTRRIRSLEQAAHDLYRQWFVEFRFPGHEDVPLVESGTEYGAIPQGWELIPIGDAVDTTGGGTPKTKVEEYWEDGDIVWFTPSDLTANDQMYISDSSRKINQLGLDNSSAKMFPAGSVMMTSRATIGVTSINTVEASTNQGFITCIPNERVSAYQIYFWVAQHFDLIMQYASGATYKEINKTTFRAIPILIADAETNQRFTEQMEPIGLQIKNLLHRSDVLRETRDLLLPRLVSGEMDVLDVEIMED